ncbi:MAG: PAS domain S-box protein [Oculatellaceae cyanobacterium bins.114]|nr:PAS domain S-box protein [Oculatellaceae cyanobacterium bins.114]
MTTEHFRGEPTSSQTIIRLLYEELVTTNNQLIALALERQEHTNQIKVANQRLAQEIAERRQIEAALQASESRFRALTERSADGIVLVDRQGICLYISPSVERILGYSPTELEGHSIFRHLYSADIKQIQQKFATCLTNPHVEFQFSFRLRTVTGDCRYLEGVGCNCLNEPSVQAIVLNYRDVSDRKRIQKEIWRLNHSLERQVKARTAQLQLSFEFEATLKRITDKVRDSLDESQIMQTAVRELAQAVGAVACNAAIYDLEQERSHVRYEFSQLSCSYQGRTLNMAIYRELYEQLLRGETFQLCSLTPNPDRGKLAVLVHPILDDQGVLGDLWLLNHQYYAFNDQDWRLIQQVANQCAIALRQARLYQTLQAQVKELERLNRLKDDFLSMASHELRAPMANIKMATQMLTIHLQATDQDIKSPINRYVQILQDECKREIGLINDLLDLARLDGASEPLELAAIDLHLQIPPLVTAFLERIQSQQQELILNIPDDLPVFYSHLESLNRVLTELLHNACKYTPSHQKIVISARMMVGNRLENQSTEKLLSLSLPHVLICVTNTGVEISVEEQERIFEKFYRLPNKDFWKRGGTGLGLALVKKLVDRLGGRIQVESKGNQTSFVLRLPLGRAS